MFHLHYYLLIGFNLFSPAGLCINRGEANGNTFPRSLLQGLPGVVAPWVEATRGNPWGWERGRGPRVAELKGRK